MGTLKVAKWEFLKVAKGKGFWAMTLIFPAFLVVLGMAPILLGQLS